MNPTANIKFDVGMGLKTVAYGLWGSVGLVTGIFLLRDFSGAFTKDLSPLAACLGTTLVAFVSLTAYACDRFASKQNSTVPIPFWGLVLLTILPPMLVGVALIPTASSLSIAWVTILGIGLAVTLHQSKPESRIAAMESAILDDEVAESSAIQVTPDLSQWMTRRLIREEGETWDQIEGQITVDFTADQQHATVHLTMCPPLPSTPEIECEVPGEMDLEWKVAAVHPYGVRLEVRRPQPATEPASIALGYTMAAHLEAVMAKKKAA